MTHHNNPLVSILLSMGAGLITWLADPVLWKAASVALLCGFLGGVGKAAGFWAWGRGKRLRSILKRRRK